MHVPVPKRLTERQWRIYDGGALRSAQVVYLPSESWAATVIKRRKKKQEREESKERDEGEGKDEIWTGQVLSSGPVIFDIHVNCYVIYFSRVSRERVRVCQKNIKLRL
jgi:hypothetical protein